MREDNEKIMKSKLVQVMLLALTVIGLYFAYQAYRRHELTQFVMWSPRAKLQVMNLWMITRQ